MGQVQNRKFCCSAATKEFGYSISLQQNMLKQRNIVEWDEFPNQPSQLRTGGFG
jgi:hypothetical protein